MPCNFGLKVGYYERYALCDVCILSPSLRDYWALFWQSVNLHVDQFDPFKTPFKTFLRIKAVFKSRASLALLLRHGLSRVKMKCPGCFNDWEAIN